VLALIVLIALVVDLALARFSPATVIPTTPLGRDRTRLAAAALVLLLLFIKFVSHTSNLGWGFWINAILAIVVVVGAWMTSNGRATQLGGSAPVG
jgi:hypothetical protein